MKRSSSTLEAALAEASPAEALPRSLQPVLVLGAARSVCSSNSSYAGSYQVRLLLHIHVQSKLNRHICDVYIGGADYSHVVVEIRVMSHLMC